VQNRTYEKKIKSDDSTLLKKFEFENEKRYTLSERSAGSIYKLNLMKRIRMSLVWGKNGLS